MLTDPIQPRQEQVHAAHTFARNLMKLNTVISLSGMICLTATRQAATTPSKPATSKNRRSPDFSEYWVRAKMMYKSTRVQAPVAAFVAARKITNYLDPKTGSIKFARTRMMATLNTSCSITTDN